MRRVPDSQRLTCKNGQRSIGEPDCVALAGSTLGRLRCGALRPEHLRSTAQSVPHSFQCRASERVSHSDSSSQCCACVKTRQLRGHHYVVGRVETDGPPTGPGYCLAFGRSRYFGQIQMEPSPELMLRQVAAMGVGTHIWQQVGLTYDGSGRRLGISVYNHGIQGMTDLHRANRLTGSIRTSAPLVIGRHFVGIIDDVRVYDCVLACEEMTFLASLPASTRLWKANEEK